ncbi:MAG: B12-binding domain-containing protein [Promethearchaeota archaeon]
MSINLINNLIELEHDKVLEEIAIRLKQGEQPLKLIEECNQAMIEIGERYKRQEYFLAELMLSGELFKEAMELIDPYLGEKRVDDDFKGKIVLATIQGDIHDLGKNILATLLKLEGFKLYDLGVDVNPDIIVEKVKEIQPDFLGFSALLTVTFDPMKLVVDKLREEGVRDHLKVMVGGGITTSLVKDYIGADFQTIDAMEGVSYCLKEIKQS